MTKKGHFASVSTGKYFFTKKHWAAQSSDQTSVDGVLQV